MTFYNLFIMIGAFAIFLEKIYSNKIFKYFDETVLFEIKLNKKKLPIIMIVILISAIIYFLVRGEVDYSFIFLFSVGVINQGMDLADIQLISERGILFKNKMIKWNQVDYYKWDKELCFVTSEGNRIIFSERNEDKTADLDALLKEAVLAEVS